VILLDSSFLVAFHNTRDVHHQRAVRLMDRFLDDEWGRGLLLEYVFLEVTTVLAMRRSLDVAVAVGDVLLRARELDFVPSSELFRDTYVTFRGQRLGDRDVLSFADAALVTVARQRDVPHIATFDDDFRNVEGVEAVPAAPPA